MMRSINKVFLIGNIGRDPELTYLSNGTVMTRFSLATSEFFSGDKHTEWHKIIAWNRLAEFAQESLEKGSRLYLEGRLRTRSWEDDSGKKHFRTELVANEMILLGDRRQHHHGDFNYEDDGEGNEDYAF